MKSDIKKKFAGKKITLMGLGLLGRGIGDAKFFASAGAELTVTDLKTAEELKPSIERLKEFSNITYHLGGHHMEDFEHRDLIIRAPNAPLDSPFIAHARELGIPIEMDAALFAKLTLATIVGVTGTRGKSTVTHLIYEMAKAARADARGSHTSAARNVYLGGNERDIATLPLLEETNADDLVVLELDSWQLQGFEEDRISPHLAVWTNFMPDHMNYYKNDMERYFQDKVAIARFQKESDYFITTKEIKEKIESRFGPLKATCITDPTLPAGWEISLPGEHNLKNAAYAVAAATCLGIPETTAKEALKNFKGLPGRLEYLGEKNGVAFYNDSNSTTPEATTAALVALTEKKKPIVLIAGGSDKELLFASLADEIAAQTKTAVLFKGKATDKLTPLLPKQFPAIIASDMREAFSAAVRSAKPGDIVLLSPGATSFGIFENEYDRGEQFNKQFRAL